MGFQILFTIFICVSLSSSFVKFYLALTMLKEIDNYIYIGGRNYLAKYSEINGKLELIKHVTYFWDSHIINGSDIGFEFIIPNWPGHYPRGPSRYAFDACLNWKQDHTDSKVRDTAFDYQHWNYHTPSGDWLVMNYICMSSFIKSVEKLDNDTLWVCGTFGAFPRAFSVNKNTLKFIKFLDVNVMSCGRYEDEPMVTHRDKLNNLYVASGWGLYRPDKTNPDVPNNNSTMLYADWRLYRNLFTLPSTMAWVLSSDVNFINVIKETNDHLYFFGHEINNQYGLHNQDDRYAWQSFMVRICKNDLGFKYLPLDIYEDLKSGTSADYLMARFNLPYVTIPEDFMVSLGHDHSDFNSSWYDDTAHLPKTHFVTPIKINFGCFIGRRPRAISDNHYWGDTNVIYMNQLADVIFDPDRKIQFSTKSGDEVLGCHGEMHHQIPLVGVFNREGLKGTNVEPSGALCQLQINENIFNEKGTPRKTYGLHPVADVNNAYKDIMRVSSTSYSNFYSRTIHRTNGYTVVPYFNQGILTGYYYKDESFVEVGKCQAPSFYKKLDSRRFLQIQNFSNLAWPNELPNRLSSMPSSICQYSAAELYSFNASFVLSGVQFKKLFLVRENISNYEMNVINKQSNSERKRFSPLMIVNIISTHGHLYRVVLCDFDNGMQNHGKDKSSGEWYNWCIFRHTDQPYLYRQYTPMENRKRGQPVQFRASSLLLDKKLVTSEDESSFPINRDPQFHIVKDVLRKGNNLHVLTTNNVSTVDMNINCSNDYTTCIKCASDPDCMWDNGKKGCVKYYEAKYEKQSMVQDVLDRGFICAQFIKASNQTVYLTTNDNKVPLTIHCDNAGYWRGEIQWKINNIIVQNDPNHYMIHMDQKYLTILKANDSIKSVSCHGIKDDLDKLFNDAEYDWITKGDYSTKLLSDYSVIQPSNGWMIFAIILLLIIIIVIAILIYLIRSLIMGQARSFCPFCTNHRNESPQHSPTRNPESREPMIETSRLKNETAS